MTSDAQLAQLFDRFSAADACWFGSVRPDGRPHLAPIWHVVHEGRVYVVTQSHAVRTANIRRNPAVSLALADTGNVLIVEGTARPANEMRAVLRPLFHAKYDWDIAHDAAYDEVIEVMPRRVLAWGSHGEGRWNLPGE
jgi:general stress protein 26